jgi:bifunctional DNase/RNase
MGAETPMPDRDWDETEGDEFNVEPFAGAQELDLRKLFPEGPGRLPDAGDDESRAPRDLDEKEVRIVGVYEQRGHDNEVAFFVMVRDNRDRHLRIYIGQQEAYSISMAVEGRAFNRPLTHDLAVLIVERLGWSVERVIVDDEYNGIFYAKLSLTSGDGARTVDIDCRPSDAIALAVRAQAPIYVAEDVLEHEGSREQEL